MSGLNVSGIGPERSFFLSLLLRTSLLLTTTANAAKPTKPSPEAGRVDLGDGLVEHMGFVAADAAGLDFTNEAIRHRYEGVTGAIRLCPIFTCPLRQRGQTRNPTKEVLS